MNFHHHPSAPHIVCYGGDQPSVFVSPSRDLTEAIAHAAKSALIDGTGPWSREWRVRVDPPDGDSPRYSVALEIPERYRSLDLGLGLLTYIAAYQRHLIEAFAPLHITLNTEDPPHWFGGCWLGWTIEPTEAAADRAVHIAAVANYQSLGEAARTARDDGHLADVYAGTADPGLPTLLRQHVELCESLAGSARRLALWQEETHDALDWPWEEAVLRDDEGNPYTIRSIASQAESQVRALERAVREARQLHHLATL